MGSGEVWLHRLGNLKLYRARHGRAPHKPLLLLMILDLAHRGELPPEILVMSPELAYRFDTYRVVFRTGRTERAVSSGRDGGTERGRNRPRCELRAAG